MSVRLKAVYRDGAFVPIPNGEKLNVSENAQVEITEHDQYVVPPTATSDEERERALCDLKESWQQHPLTADAPRLTRDELHERRPIRFYMRTLRNLRDLRRYSVTINNPQQVNIAADGAQQVNVSRTETVV